MANVALTGGGGYVGSRLVPVLAKSHNVHLLGARAEDENFQGLVGVDTVIHLAGLAHGKSKNKQSEIFCVNTLFPLKLAKQAKRLGVKRFIFLSSTSVYDQSLSKVDEESACRPGDAYGWSKLLAEQALRALEDADFSVIILRAPMIYGYGAPGNPAKLVRAVRLFKFVPLGGINNQRTFLNVDSLVRVIGEVLNHEFSGTFCVADDRSISTSELVWILADLEGLEVKLLKVYFFSPLLKKIAPSIWIKIYGNSEVDNGALKDELYNLQVSVSFSSTSTGYME